MNELTAVNIRKVTRFRQNGVQSLTNAVKKLAIERKATQIDDQERFEATGERHEFTTEVPRSDSRFDERRGPGRLIKRRIGKDEHIDVKNR